ncbi:MAG: Gfo/Idh/MocA family protein [Propionibacteriaceae bacterium]
MNRIGIVGIENSHVDHFIRLLNVEERHPGTRVTALAGGEAGRREQLAETGGITDLLDGPTDLVTAVEAVIVSSRDGRLHCEQALPAVEAGLPVLVDKPLAASIADAQQLLDAAKGSGAPLLSSSAVRHTPQVATLAATAAGWADTQVVAVTGPADPTSEHAGLFFYGIHVVETALELAGDGPFGPVTVQRTGGSILATTTVGDTHLVMTFVPPGDERVPFHATLVGRHGITGADLVLGPDYNAPVLAQFIDMISTRKPPLTSEALLRPVQLLAGIVDQL